MTLGEYIESLKGRRVCVIGAGISNTDLTDLLLDSGISVSVRDMRGADKLGEKARRFREKGADLRLGEDYLEDLDYDVIFRTPGLLPTNPALRDAARRGARITSEMEVFFSLCPCRTVAVTGSDGKTTTSSIIAELLRAGGHRVHLGGNIGRPLLTEVPDIMPGDTAVLELSSFQLHSISIGPDTAVVTNVSPNHLDVHPDFDDYVRAKERIFANQRSTDMIVLNADNPVTARFAQEAPSSVKLFSRREILKNGVFCRDGNIYYSDNYEVRSIIPASEILLPGVHNIENYMAAFAAVESMVSPEMCRKVARTYGGVPHRLELVRKLDGVSYINDSIASSPTRTIAGLRAMRTKPILIAGGHDKNIPFDALADEIAERVKALFVSGDTAGKIADAVRSSVFYNPQTLPIITEPDIVSAINDARAMAVPGDVVLLSPACSSFDRFSNFAERGDLFRNTVLEFESSDIQRNIQ